MDTPNRRAAVGMLSCFSRVKFLGAWCRKNVDTVRQEAHLSQPESERLEIT